METGSVLALIEITPSFLTYSDVIFMKTKNDLELGFCVVRVIGWENVNGNGSWII
jgi:hypothetical protein